MGKGAKGKSSATSGTRKKHAKRATFPEENVKKVVTKGRGKKKDKEPRKKVYIPPIKPAPVQPDPLETTGLAHSLPPELLVVLRSFSKKAQVTKIRALEELNTAWVERALGEGEDGSLVYTLVEMLPVWMHHVPALFLHPSRRVRGLTATIHFSFLRIPQVRDQMTFFLRETATSTQIERILGAWAMAAHDIDRNVAATASNAWKGAIGTNAGQLQLDDTFRDSFLDFVEQTALDPEGIYAQLNPVQMPVSQPQPKKAPGRSAPAKKVEDPESGVRSKMDEAEEGDQDKKARLRIGALGAFGWLVGSTKKLSERALVLFSNPAFLTSLSPSLQPPWIDMEGFGHSQPSVRKAMWTLLHILLAGHKEHLSNSIPALSRAMLRSAWVEQDPSVQAVLWHPLLMFLKDFPSAWEVASTTEPEDKEDSDSEDGSEAENEGELSARPTPGSGAYDEFLQFLRSGCGGSPIQGYPIIIISLSTVPSSMLFPSGFQGLDNFFTAFWEALDSRALSSLNRANASSAFLSSILECMGFLVRRLMTFSTTKGDPTSHADIEAKALEVVEAQINKTWQELSTGNLKVDDVILAKEFGKTVSYLSRVKRELHNAAWKAIQSATASVSKTNPSMVATFVKGLSEVNAQPPQGSLLVDLAKDALVAYEENSDDPKARQLLPDLLIRFQGDLFQDAAFVKRLEVLLSENSDTMLETSPTFVLSVLSYWRDEVKANRLWQRLLSHLASQASESKPLSMLLTVLEALGKGKLPAWLRPTSDVFDVVTAQLFRDISRFAALKGILAYHTYFMTDIGFRSLFTDIASSLKYHLADIVDGVASPSGNNNALLGLAFSTYTASPAVLSTTEGLHALMVQVFLYGRLLPLCRRQELAVQNGEIDTFCLARDFWYFWYSAKSTLDWQRGAVLGAVKEQLRVLILGTGNPRVSPQAVLSLLLERVAEFNNDNILDFLPTEDEFGSMLSKLTPLAIHSSMAVIDPLLSPSPSSSSTSPSGNDHTGFSSYARAVSTLLQLLSGNRTLAKVNIWALRHFLALSIYISDFQSLPGRSNPVFDERALGFVAPSDPSSSSSASSVPTLSLPEISAKIDQMTTYLLLSGDSSGEPWRRNAAEALLNEGDVQRQLRKTTLGHFLVQVVNEARARDSPRETRILRIVLDHVLEDVDVADVDPWLTLARKLERSAPETSMSIIHVVNRLGLASPKLDRYRNEAAASLLDIPAKKINTEGLLALRRLAASAPDPDSDVVFLPQLRSVNAVKAMQKWVEDSGGGDEDDEDENEGGVDEHVENAMLPVFASLAPILQNDHGKHWEFIFDVVETVLENSSVSDDETLVGLARALRMVIVLEDLCATNKALRAEWEPRRANVLTTVRDLAAAKLDDVSVSLPRSICRESLLSIVQSLPASFIDHETLGNMCHLITDLSSDVQKMAYQMLKTAAEQRTEYLVIEVGVGNIGGDNIEEPEPPTTSDAPEGTLEQQAKGGKKKKQKETEKKDTGPALLPEELVAIIQQDVSLVFPTGEDDDVLEQRAFGWMLGWMLVFDLFSNASFKVKSMYIEQLRNHDLVGSRLLPNIVSALQLDGGLNKAFKIQLWGVNEFFIRYYEPSAAISIPVLAAHLYYRALLCVPSLVHTWVLDCKDRQLSNAITTTTSQCFSPLIIQAELAHVRSPEGVAELTGDGLTVKVIGGSAGSEVVAAYAVDDHQLEIRLKIPSDWPLHRIEVKDEKRVGVDENRWRAWVLAVQQTIWTHNGRIVDGLSLFKKNVTLHFEGQVECAICYSIISVMDGSLPKKPCKTCKNRFHAGCLYKWFNTSHSSSCPLCRTNII